MYIYIFFINLCVLLQLQGGDYFAMCGRCCETTVQHVVNGKTDVTPVSTRVRARVCAG